MYKIISPRLLSNTRHPSSDAISSHKAWYHTPVSPAEGMFSRFKVPQTENGNLLLEERFALFAGEYEEPFICILVAHQIWWVTVVLKWWSKGKSQLFLEPSLQLPLMPLRDKLICLAILSDFKITCTWGLEVCVHGCKCPQSTLGYLKRNFSHTYLFTGVCEHHVESRDKGKSWFSPSATWILRTTFHAERSCQPLLATS